MGPGPGPGPTWEFWLPDRVSRSGVWLSRIKVLSIKNISGYSEWSLGVSNHFILLVKQHHKTASFSLQSSGSRLPSDQTKKKSFLTLTSDHKLFRKSKIIKIPSRSSENGSPKVHRSQGGGPPKCSGSRNVKSRANFKSRLTCTDYIDSQEKHSGPGQTLHVLGQQ